MFNKTVDIIIMSIMLAICALELGHHLFSPFEVLLGSMMGPAHGQSPIEVSQIVELIRQFDQLRFV